ncbi:MAG: cytochrome P450 [Hyphomicrobiales bacterium]|nr:MAG: cytochrome P450 [Hyphomicrobiales bacterium]
MLQTIPDHVPASVVREFDFFRQPELLENPHDAVGSVFADLEPRILFTPYNGGHWVVGGYDELLAAFRDVKTFSSTTMQIPTMTEEPKLIPLNLDPPEHTNFRAPLATALRPERVHPLEPEIRTLTRQLIGEIQAAGEGNFVSAISEPLPIYIFLRIVGVPPEKFRQFRDHVKQYLSNPADRSENSARFDEELEQLIRDKIDQPADDLLSTLIGSEIGGRRPTFAELMGYCRLLMLAGLDTVTNAMSFGMRHLAIDQALQKDLRENPERVPLAVEELLRRYSFANLGRICLRDTELHGLQFRKGDRVLLMLAGGGLDPATFPEPETVHIDRQGKAQPAFGFGKHHCVGVHLARLELKVLYQEWLSAIPQFRIKKDTTPHFHAGVVIGIEELQLDWATR